MSVSSTSTPDVIGLVPLDDETMRGLDASVDRYVRDLLSCAAHSPEFDAKADQLAYLGQREIDAATDDFSRSAECSMNSPARTDIDHNLAKLRNVLNQLDPDRADDQLKRRRVLSIFSAEPKLKPYFDQYAPVQATLDEVLRGLANARDDLLHDNIAIDINRERRWEQMVQLRQMIHVATALEARLADAVVDLSTNDAVKAEAIRARVLYPMRQRAVDLQVQLALSAQDQLAMDLVRKNNAALIDGLNRSLDATIAALQTAILAARQLAGQRLILDQIDAIDEAAANMADANHSANARRGGSRIVPEPLPPTVSMEELQRAFANVRATMDSVDHLTTEAVMSLKDTVDTLATSVDHA